MRIKPKDFRDAVNHALDKHFPKGQCKERSAGLMVFATAILEYEKTVEQVKLHMSNLLAVAPNREDSDYKEAKDFYLNLK